MPQGPRAIGKRTAAGHRSRGRNKVDEFGRLSSDVKAMPGTDRTGSYSRRGGRYRGAAVAAVASSAARWFG